MRSLAYYWRSKHRTFGLLLALCVMCQVLFWQRTHDILPQMTIVPEVPSDRAIHALSFGDEQFLFRVLALQMQNFGDTFGRFTALKLYDFKKLRQWFRVLDVLDNRSNSIPSLATYYFSQTQNHPDVRYIVDYLYDHSKDRVNEKWWWLVQAIYLANYKVGDNDLALKVAQPLLNVDTNKVPVWVKQMPAFVHEQRGEMEDALAIMDNIKKTAQHLTPGELNFMRYFVEERIGALEKQTKEQEKH